MDTAFLSIVRVSAAYSVVVGACKLKSRIWLLTK